MTEASLPQAHDGPHDGPIKTPRQLILAVLWAHIIPIVGILLLVFFVTAHNRPAAGSDGLTPAAIAKRIQPVGRVEVRDVSDVASMKSGEQVFAAQCTACHTAGVAGAPKFGDTAAWAPRIATGYPTLLHSALAGKGAMGPQGGGDFSDLEIGRAVVYMANKGGAKFEEPKAAAADATTAAAPANSTSPANTTAAAGAAPAVAAAPATNTAPAANAAPAVAAAPATNTAPAANAAPAANPATAGAAVAAKPAEAGDAAATAAVATAKAAMANVAAAAPKAPAAAEAHAAAGVAAGAAVPALYAQICQACHDQGVAGAPKLGDKAAWAPRLAQGIDALTASAIKGKNAMPPKGGSNASDADIKAVVTYMAGAAK